VVPRVARTVFYRWFDELLEQLMAALADRALGYARTPGNELLSCLPSHLSNLHESVHSSIDQGSTTY
jgi:hypothetical protein